MEDNERSKNEVTMKVHAGGTGMAFFLSITTFFWVFFFWGMTIDQIRALESHITYNSFVIDLIAGLALCILFSTYTFIYWKFNFIELKSDRLIASVLYRSWVWDWSKATIIPKFIKTNIALKDISTVSLRKTGRISPVVFEIIDKNNRPHYIDTKPFSKTGGWLLIKELERNGIKVDIEKGAI